MLKINHGTPKPERDSFFILNGKSYRYSSKALFLNCELEASPYYLPKEYTIPINVSNEGLEMFIEALEEPEIEINTQHIADLYCLCQLFNFKRVLSKLDEYYASQDGESKIIDQVIISHVNRIDTIKLEEEIVKIISNIIKYKTFYSLPPEILTRIIINANLSSNDIVDVIKLLKEGGKKMNCYLSIYSLIEFKDLYLENRLFLLDECQDPDVTYALSNFLKSYVINQQNMLQVQEEEINARDESINAKNEAIKDLFEICKRYMEKIKQYLENSKQLIEKIMPAFAFPKPSPEATLSEKVDMCSKDQRCYENILMLAEKGFAESQFKIGLMYLTGSNPMIEIDKKKAFEWFHKSAIHGDSDAQNLIGIYYFKGSIIDEDFEKAFYYFNRSAKSGCIKAQINLGYMYECGKHVATNKEKALNWYMKAADKGDPIAQHACGMLHYEGINASPDLKAASMFLKKAADQDYEPSIVKINEMKKIGEYIEYNDQEHNSID